MSDNITKMADQVIAGVQDYIRRCIGPVAERLKALEARPPVPGEKGDPGAAGDPGQPGEKGEPGVKGERGEAGLAGQDGSDGANGQDGVDGRDGRDGEPGRDAVQIEVLDAIDAAKKYQRGTYAHLRGGLVRSFRATDPLPPGAPLEKAGWHVVVRGVDAITVDLAEDLRSVTVRHALTDGAVVEKQVKVPALVYREIWREGTYEQGDAVTRDGSTWICRVASTTATPGTSEDWKLAVKKGRDGKDGIRGEKGDRGTEGRAGKDLTQMGSDGKKW